MIVDIRHKTWAKKLAISVLGFWTVYDNICRDDSLFLQNEGETTSFQQQNVGMKLSFINHRNNPIVKASGEAHELHFTE